MPPLLFSQNVNICSVCILIASPGCLVEDEGCGHSDASGTLAMCWDFVSYDRSLASRQPPGSVPLTKLQLWLSLKPGIILFLSAERKPRTIILYTHQTTGAWVRVYNDKGLLHSTFASFLLITLIFFV